MPVIFSYGGIFFALAWHTQSHLALDWINKLMNPMNISDFSNKSQRNIFGFFMLLILSILFMVLGLNKISEQLVIIALFLLGISFASQFYAKKYSQNTLNPPLKNF